MSELEPKEPEEAGIPQETPELAQIEAARRLADEAKDRLKATGFDEDQIEKWAETYIAEVGSGDVESFLKWVETQERT